MGFCYGNFFIGFNIVVLVLFLFDFVFYLVFDFFLCFMELSDLLLMFVIYRYF